MAATKFCKLCGRDRHDPDEHELVKVGRNRRRVCKNLVLVAEQSARDLVTGERRVIKRYVPDNPQRTAANRTRWVHRGTLAAIDRQEALK